MGITTSTAVLPPPVRPLDFCAVVSCPAIPVDEDDGVDDIPEDELSLVGKLVDVTTRVKVAY